MGKAAAQKKWSMVHVVKHGIRIHIWSLIYGLVGRYKWFNLVVPVQLLCSCLFSFFDLILFAILAQDLSLLFSFEEPGSVIFPALLREPAHLSVQLLSFVALAMSQWPDRRDHRDRGDRRGHRDQGWSYGQGGGGAPHNPY